MEANKGKAQEKMETHICAVEQNKTTSGHQSESIKPVTGPIAKK